MKRLLTIENLLWVLIFAVPLYLIKFTFFNIPTNIFEALLLLAIVFCLTKEKRNALNEIKKIPKKITFSILAILAGVFLSIILNDNYKSGFGVLKSWFIVPIFSSFFFYYFAKSKNIVEKFFSAACLSAAFVGLLSLIYKFFEITTYDGRLRAFFLSPNHLAMYLAPGIFFCLYFIYQSHLQNNKRRLCFYLTMMAFIITPLYFTFSYGAWIAVFFSSIFLIFLYFPRKRFVLLALLSMFLAIFSMQLGKEKLGSLASLSSRSSLASRVTIWKASLLMLKQSPFAGIGPNNFQNSYLELQKFFPPYLEWAVPQPHNIFLAFWLESGMLGFMGFLLLLFFIFKKLFKNRLMLAFPLLGFFIYTTLHGLIDTPFWKNDLSFLFWLCIFLAIAITQNKNQAIRA